MVATKIIYHQVKPGIDCPDGIWSAFIAKRKFPDAEVIGWCYSHTDNPVVPEVEKGDRLIIVDFSFPESVYRKWSERGIETLTLDHHKGAWDDLQVLQLSSKPSFWGAIANFLKLNAETSNLNKNQIRFDLNESGATLTWKHFFPNQPVPPVLQYVRDRDLWNHQLPGTKEMHEAIASLRGQYKRQGRDIFELFSSLIKLSQEDLLAIFEPMGQDLLFQKSKKVKAIADTYYMDELDGFTVPHVKIEPGDERFCSDVGSYLNQTLKPLFVVMITTDGQYHLRSDKNGSNFDLIPITKKYGGGGHPNAAGFTISKQQGE